jgi:hypothetical protein
MPLAITPAIYAPGAGGVPSTATPYSIGQRITSYTHTISATGGFESASFSFVCDKDEGLTWLRRLMCSVVVYGPDAQVIWEGFISRVTFTIGGQTRSVSLDSMFNRTRVRYTNALGGAGTTTVASNAASIARYGTKDGVLSLNSTDATPAANYRDAMLARSAQPRMEPQTRISTGQQQVRPPTLQIECSGWFYALDWLITSNTSTTSVATGTQIATLLAAYNAVNAFLSSETRFIATTGVSAPEFIAPDTPYRQKIEELLSIGTSTPQRLAYGVYTGRVLVTQAWAGASPSVIGYRGWLATGRLANKWGGAVDAWDVRPDAMLEIVDLLDPSPVSTAPDAAARQYIERVTCSVSGDQWSVDLEPENTEALGAVLSFSNTRRPWQ